MQEQHAPVDDAIAGVLLADPPGAQGAIALDGPAYTPAERRIRRNADLAGALAIFATLLPWYAFFLFSLYVGGETDATGAIAGAAWIFAIWLVGVALLSWCWWRGRQRLWEVALAWVAVAALTGESVSGNVFDANDTTFSAVTGDQCEYIVLYKHTGTDSTSRLICIFDTATNLPVTPNGGDIVVSWDNGASKIFAL